MDMLLATFLSFVRGARFYDVAVPAVGGGGREVLQLDTNTHDQNCVAVYL